MWKSLVVCCDKLHDHHLLYNCSMHGESFACEASLVHYNASKSIGSFGCESWYEHHAERSNLKAGQCNDPDPQQTPLTLRNALPRPRQIQISNHNLVVIRYWYCDLGDWHPSLGLGGWVVGGTRNPGQKSVNWSRAHHRWQHEWEYKERWYIWACAAKRWVHFPIFVSLTIYNCSALSAKLLALQLLALINWWWFTQQNWILELPLIIA